MDTETLIINSREDFAQWAMDRRFEPAMGEDARNAKRARWRQAVQRAKGWVSP